MPRTVPGERRQAILEAVAQMLERDEAVTTAALARRLEVSEAALYRHFPSKARMFEALLDFVEETLFPRLAAALAPTNGVFAGERYARALWLVLAFIEKNPGLARLLHGDGLAGEVERVRQRGAQVVGKIDAHMRQALRESEWRGELAISQTAAAGLLLAVLEGRLARYIRTRFRELPTQDWDQLAAVLSAALFREPAPDVQHSRD